MITSIAFALLTAHFQAPDATEARLLNVVTVALARPTAARDFAFSEARFSSKTIEPLKTRTDRAKAEGGTLDVFTLRPGGGLAQGSMDGNSEGAGPSGHRLSMLLAAFETPEQASYSAWMSSDAPGGRRKPSEKGSPSGYPLGRLVWPLFDPLPKSAFSLMALDGTLLFEVTFMAGMAASAGPGSAYREPPPGIVETVEALARQILARAQAARAGLAGAQTTGGRQAPQRRAAGVAFAGFDRPANLKAGIFTFRQGARTVVAPLSAYEIRVNGRPIKLKQPVMEADGRIWIETAALR